MILNKSSFERGFAHASVYKTECVELVDERNKATRSRVFHRPAKEEISTKVVIGCGNNQQDASAQYLDEDGLPPVGLYVEQGDIVYSVLDQDTGKVTFHRHESSEPAYVEEVRILDGDKEHGVQKVSIKYRYNRNPVVGDKFSSRHGQKGVCCRCCGRRSTCRSRAAASRRTASSTRTRSPRE